MDPLEELFNLFEAEIKTKPKVAKAKPPVNAPVEDEPQGHPANTVVKNLSSGLDKLAADLGNKVVDPKYQDPNPMVQAPTRVQPEIDDKSSEEPTVDPAGTPTIGTPPENVHPAAQQNQRLKDSIRRGLSPEDAFAAEYGRPPTAKDAEEFAKFLGSYTDDKLKDITEPEEDSSSLYAKDYEASKGPTPEEEAEDLQDQQRDAALNSKNPEEVAAAVEEIEDENYDWTVELEKYQSDSLEDLEKTKQITDRIRKNNEKLFGALREQLAKIPSDSTRKSFLQAMIHARTFETRNNSGKGKNQLGYVDVQNLIANRDRLLQGYGDGSPQAIETFVRSVRSLPVDDDFVAASYEVLPEKFKLALKGKGKVGTTAALKDIHFLGYDKDGNPRRGQATTNDRARLIWKMYLEQGGVDAYTGLPLDLESVDLEHVRGFNNKDDGPPTEEDHKNREHEKNMVLIASNVNQLKKDLSMENFMKKQVDIKKDWTEDQYGGEAAMYDRQNQILSDSVKFAKTLTQDNKFVPDMTPDLIKNYFLMDDQKYEQARKEIMESGTLTKQQKTKLQQMKSQLGKEIITALGLPRGSATPDGRRSVSFPVDNYYRGFIYSMIKAGPEEYDRYKDGWRQAIAAANQSRTKADAVRVLKELGLIDDEVLNDKKLGRVFREDFDWKATEELAHVSLTEDLQTWYNDLEFICKYGRV